MSILYGSLDNLRPKFSGKFADREDLSRAEPAGPVLLPHLQRVFLLVDADENRRHAVHVKGFHLAERGHPHRTRPHVFPSQGYGLLQANVADQGHRHWRCIGCFRLRSHRSKRGVLSSLAMRSSVSWIFCISPECDGAGSLHVPVSLCSFAMKGRQLSALLSEERRA